MLQQLRIVATGVPIMARIVDHACASEECISHKIAAMCSQTGWIVTKELHKDQPVDACGYIAADAVSHLQAAALAKANGWVNCTLPNYESLQCIDRGDAVLQRASAGRILDSDAVNRLVRHYSNLTSNPGAAEEWWGGAVALDHFLEGIAEFAEQVCKGGQQQHQWRAWVVNAQTSTQLGSHWFMAAAGRQVIPCSSGALLQSTHTGQTSCSSGHAHPPAEGASSANAAGDSTFGRLFDASQPINADVLQ